MRLNHAIQAAVLLAGGALLAPGAASAQATTPCDLANLKAGTVNVGCEIQFGGRTRTFDVELPSSPKQARALTLEAHGFTSSAAAQRPLSGLGTLVEPMKMVRILPQGIENSFNAGAGGVFKGANCCGTALMQNLDDVGFFKAAVLAVEKSVGLSGELRAVSGLSNGMAMTDRVTCEAGDFFDMGMGVSFQLPDGNLAGCKASPGFIYSEFHGTNDQVVPFAAPTASLNTGAADKAPAQLAVLRGCAATPQISRLNSNTMCQTFSGCEGGGMVQMCTVQDGTHVLYPNIAGPDNFPVAFGRVLQQAMDLKAQKAGAVAAPAAGAPAPAAPRPPAPAARPAPSL